VSIGIELPAVGQQVSPKTASRLSPPWVKTFFKKNLGRRRAEAWIYRDADAANVTRRWNSVTRLTCAFQS